MAAATSLVRVFESTIQSASVMTDDMSHLDMLYAFKITSKLQEHMFEILVQMLSNELTSKPSMPTLHDPFRKSNAFLNHPGSNKSSFNIGNRSHLNTLKRRQKKFNLPQRTPLTQTHRPVHNVPVSSVEGNSISLLEESVLMNPIGEQQPSTSQIPNSNPSLFDTSISLKSHENSMITQNQNETSKDEVENPHTENSAIVDENFAMADQVMLANQSTDNNHFNNSEQHKSFFSQDEIQLIEIKDEEDVMEDMSKDEDNVDLNFSTNLGDLKYASLAQIPGPSNSKSSESPSQLVGSRPPPLLVSGLVPSTRIPASLASSCIVLDNNLHRLFPIPPTRCKRHPQRQCRVCFRHGKRRDVRYMCVQCSDHPALCVGECFHIYHLSQTFSPSLYAKNSKRPLKRLKSE